MKQKSVNFIVPLVVYPFDVMFSFGETDDELKKKFGNLKVNVGGYFNNPLRKGRCSQFETGQIIVRLRDYPVTSSDYGCLQHEIYHAVNYLMDFIGNKYCSDSEESFAYTIGYLTEKVYAKINKK